eukprot:15355076-Ditylum_brightwellii.AAC.1
MSIKLQHRAITMVKTQIGIHDEDIPASTVNNTILTQEDLLQEENKNAINHSSIVHTPDHSNGKEAKDTIDDHSYHDEDIPASTVNNIVFTPEESKEENENAMKNNNLDEQDKGNDNIHSPDYSNGEDANKT